MNKETKGEEEIIFTYKADVAWRELGGERIKKEALVFASELIGCVNLNVATSAQSSLIGTTYQCSRSFLTYITLYLHLENQRNLQKKGSSLCLLCFFP